MAKAIVKKKKSRVGPGLQPVSAPHDSAHTHVQGKSEFIDDRSPLRNEVTVGLVLGSPAHARFQFLNVDEVMKLPGVLGFYTAQDFAHNLWGTIFQDQPLLGDALVQYSGEAIAIIAASDDHALRNAQAKLKIRYEELPAILSIEAARKAQSFLGFERKIESGNVKSGFSKSDHLLEGSIEIAGAEHFYLEPQCAIAIPHDNGSIEVWSSTQHPTEVQHVVAHGLGLSSHQVVVNVKRMGGGFGGKESQSAPIAAYAACVAKKLNRPARLVLTREEDMALTGKRNPFKNFYKVGFDSKGKILALEMNLFSDAGAYADLSTSIMERAMLHSDSAYYIPNMRIVGRVCRTHFHPHTAFRGFGAPKGVLAVERMIEEIAHFLKMDPLKIRKINCYRGKNNLTHYGQRVENNCLPELFDQLEKSADYKKRRAEIAGYNQSALAKNSPLLRGLSLTPVKFGISFTTRFLNQGNALVNIYRDGSIQVSTGATEMGQGAYRKISQIVAEEFGVSLDQVRIMTTSTEKNANTSPTAASSGTDINGAAAALACQQIKGRLSAFFLQLLKRDPKRWASLTAGLGTETEIIVPTQVPTQSLQKASRYSNVEFADNYVFVKGKGKKLRFADLCNEAYLNRVSLSDYAHYAIPGLGFDKVKGQGKGAFLYYTQGVACTEVSVHRVHGEVKVLRSDILMDLGRPINRGIDLGQVSGAFVQGLGWLTMEKLHYSSKGALLSLGPSTYKIPAVHDIPRIWNIDLLNNLGSTKSLRGSKAVGEPPLLLAISAWTAIQNALAALPDYRENYPSLNVPAHGEAILRKLYPADFAALEAPSP